MHPTGRSAIADVPGVLRMMSVASYRRPVHTFPRLDALFLRLGHCTDTDQAMLTEEGIWEIWMSHPNHAAAQTLEAATRDIAARRYDIAETRLALLLRRAPTFAEAWHKRATLYYMLARDDEFVCDIGRTLELEPRHFCAMLHFAELLLARGHREEARFASFAALRVHPFLERARSVAAEG